MQHNLKFHGVLGDIIHHQKVNNPKKKKLKHVQLIKRTDDTIACRINNNVALSNEDIKYAIKNIQ